MVIFAEQKFTEIPVPRICIENATTVPKMKIIMQCNNILMFLQKNGSQSIFYCISGTEISEELIFKISVPEPSKSVPKMAQDDFFSKSHENFEKTHSSQILRSWNKVFVKSPILKCECLNYLFKGIAPSFALKSHQKTQIFELASQNFRKAA